MTCYSVVRASFPHRAAAPALPAALRFSLMPFFARDTFGAVPLRAVDFPPVRGDFFAAPFFFVVLFREAMAPPW